MKVFLFLLLVLSVYAQIGSNCTIKNQKYQCGQQFVCLNGICSHCEIGKAQCSDYPLYICKMDGNTNITNFCAHKNLFPNISIYDILATFFCFIGSMLAAQAGVGGGGIFVPILILIGGFDHQLSIALSKAIIFGGAITNFIFFSLRRHPKYPEVNRPLIDYDICMLIEPIVLAGTIIGVFLNIMFPYWLVVILLLLLLGITTYRTLRKGLTQYKNETKQKEKIEEEEKKELEEEIDEYATIDAEKQVVEVEMKENDEINVVENEEVNELPTEESQEEKMEESKNEENRSSIDDIPVRKSQSHVFFENDEFFSPPSVESQKSLDRILKFEAFRFPFYKAIPLFISWLIILVVSLMKGGHGVPSILGIEKCGWIYWIVVFSVFPVLVLISLCVAVYLRLFYVKKKKLGYEFTEGDVKYSLKNTFLIPTVCLFAGIVAGLLGVGGGLVTGPVLLELGVLSQISTSSSAYMILFTSSSTTLQYFIFGLLPWDYGLFFGFVGLIASIFGQVVVSWVVKKFGRPSWIVFLLAFVVGISTVLLVGLGSYRVILDIIHGAYLGFNPPC
eukprot:gene215-4461_t